MANFSSTAIISRTGGSSMAYVTEQAVYHAWYRLKPGKLAATLQSISRPALPAIVRHASRATRERPPFDLVAARSPDASQARILIWDRGVVPTCAHAQVRPRPSQTGLGGRRQPGNSPQGPFSHIAYWARWRDAIGLRPQDPRASHSDTMFRNSHTKGGRETWRHPQRE